MPGSVIAVIILHLLLPHCTRVMASGGNEFLQAWLVVCTSNLDNAWAVFVCISVGGWVMLFDDGYVDNLVPLSVVCGTGVLSSWYLLWCWYGGGLLGIGSGIAGVSCFLRNLQFRKGILPDPSTLIWYWWLGRVSMIWTVVSHQQVLWHCIETVCFFLKWA